jgi:hypothetical protein
VCCSKETDAGIDNGGRKETKNTPKDLSITSNPSVEII